MHAELYHTQSRVKSSQRVDGLFTFCVVNHSEFSTGVCVYVCVFELEYSVNVNLPPPSRPHPCLS